LAAPSAGDHSRARKTRLTLHLNPRRPVCDGRPQQLAHDVNAHRPLREQRRGVHRQRHAPTVSELSDHEKKLSDGAT